MSSFFHGSIEVQIRHEPPWFDFAPAIHVSDPHNKLLFSFLSGGALGFDVDPIAPPRGLPDDVSDEVRRVHKECGDLVEETSWVTWLELMSSIDKIRQVAMDQKDPEAFIRDHISLDIQAISAYMMVYEVHGWRTRFIFWKAIA